MITAQRYEPNADLGVLVDHPDNPRRGDDAAVSSSIDALGFYGAIIAQESTRRILAGHTRRRALAAAGTAHAPVLWLDVDDTTATRILLADNRTAELASWDDEQLAETLRSLADESFDLAALGWQEDELAELLLGDASLLDETEDVGRIAPLIYSDECVIDAAFEHYRATGFPYPVVPRHAAMQQINALAGVDAEHLVNTTVAYHVADPYHPHRYDTRVHSKLTSVEVFRRDKPFTHALRLTLDNGKITDASVLGTLAYTRGAQLVTHFRPGFVLSMYRRFAPPGSSVLDTSTGYGSALVAFFASHCANFIGIDPNTATQAGNAALLHDLRPEDKTAELICLPAEDVPHDLVAGRADFAFTSPPYFAKELYSDEPTQSCVRYGSGDAWRDGFLVPMLRLQYAALVAEAFSCINIADVDLGGVTYPLVDWTIDAARQVGFDYVATEKYPLSRVPGRGEAREAFESVVVLRRPDA